MKYLILSSILLFAIPIYAKKDKIQLKTLVERISELTGRKYIYPNDIKGSIGITKNLKLTKGNADRILSHVLNINGYTRVDSKNGYKEIVPARDVRYVPTPLYEASKKKFPNIILNHDYIVLKYTFKHPVMAKELVRNFRPFMSRYGRIIDMDSTGIVMISDTAINVKRFYDLAVTIDKEPSDDYVEKVEDWEELDREIRLAKAKNCNEKR